MAEDAPADAEVVHTEPPKADPSTGVAMYGDYPLNGRLRTEALAQAEVENDPDGLVTPEAIADAKARLARAAEAAEKIEADRLAAFPPVNESMTVAALEEIAGKEGADLEGATNNAQRVERITANRELSANPTPPVPTPPAEPVKPESEEK